MAVVAFPFTCIMADELQEEESESPLVSFGGSATTNSSSGGAKQQQTHEPMSDMMDESAHDCCDDQQESDAASVPSLMAPNTNEKEAEPVLQDETMIDDAFFEELEGDNDNSSQTVGNDNQNAAVDGDVAMNDTVEDTEQIQAISSNNNDTTTTTALPQAPASFGGLSNLGNTCYLNSAIQMVASLDSFADHLKNNPLPEFPTNEDTSSGEQDQKGLLRAAFLDVMDSLAAGETVRPNEFKRLLDERTPLFVGFRQQDSHEFLTTLFDLLDEDYKVKPPAPAPAAPAVASEEVTIVKDVENISEANESEPPKGEDIQETEVTIDTNTDTGDEVKETDQVANSETQQGEAKEEQAQNADGTMESEQKSQSESETYESATKKPRNVAVIALPTPTETNSLFASPTRVQSFTDLKPEGIEKLLHANLLVDNQIQSTAATPTPPRCKLVGGRMAAHDNHAHDMLLSEEDSDVATSSMCIACDEAEGEEAKCTSISPVESYLKTETRVRLTCDSCKYTRVHTESYFHLSLEIGSDSSSVAEGLRKFFSPEKREVKCEKCFCETATQTTEITRLPRALLLHFKRFIVDISDDYASITYRKNQSDVLFEDKLDLAEERGGVLAEFVVDDVTMPVSDFDKDCHAYKIRSVVNHIGSSASCGHYTADAARLSPSVASSEMSDNCEERQWKRFNDSYVTSIAPDDALKESCRTAYMVMYELS